MAAPLARIVRWEAITSLGESAAETMLLLRAGVTNVQRSPFVDGAGRRVEVCASPSLAFGPPAVERMAALAAHAIERLCRSMPQLTEETPGETGGPVLLIALPEALREAAQAPAPMSDVRSFLHALRRKLPAPLAAAEIEPFPFGRAAGAVALQRALTLIERGRLVVWGGADSLIDWRRLQGLAETDRLVTEENVDGVRPGEGAAFACLAPAGDRDGIALLGLGIGREPRPVGSDQPCLSDGLSAALDDALKPLRAAGRRSGVWLFDSTHEMYATHEVQNVIARFADAIAIDVDLQTPLKELGDVGAAALPLLVVLAAETSWSGLAADDTAVVAVSSDGGERGAVLLGMPPVSAVRAAA